MTAPRINVLLQFAGRNFKAVFTAVGGLSGVPCAIKVTRNRDDATAVATGSTSTGEITIDSDTQLTVEFGADVTEDWPIRQLWYAVEARPNTAERWPIAYGTIAMQRRITLTRTSFSAVAGSDATRLYGVATAMAGSVLGGTGPFTYAWSVVSKPRGGLVDFSDASSPTSPVMLAGPNGAFRLRLTATDSLGSVASDDVTLTVADSPLGSGPPDLLLLGSALRRYWEEPVVPSPYVTLDSGNRVQLLANRSSAGAVGDITPAVPPGTAFHHATGGPDDGPMLEIASTTASLHGSLSIGAANRVCHYLICSVPTFADSPVGRLPFAAGVGNTGHVFIGGRVAGGDQYAAQVDFTSGTQPLPITTPAFDDGYHSHAFYPLATRAVYGIDDVPTVPNFTGTSTVVACDLVSLGFSTLSAGKFAGACIFDYTDANKLIVRSWGAYLLDR